jgi:hypothetical protein
VFFLVCHIFVYLERTSNNRQTSEWMKEEMSEAKLFQDLSWMDKKKRNVHESEHKILVLASVVG